MATVDTCYGRIEGAEDRGTVVFRGIPYASPPTGSRRFLPPAGPTPWAGTRDATAFCAACPQDNVIEDTTGLAAAAAEVPQSEDCLYLNVWTRATGSGGKRPVMVWLHGGGFQAGVGATGVSNGAALVDRGDVVVVSLNHRLNVFGYLNLADVSNRFEGSGVAGVLDIVMALRWIRDNIGEFGGDPDNVTLFGVSGGGRKISVLLGMPIAQGLFAKAIIMSGAHPRGVAKSVATEFAEGLLAHLDIAPDGLDALQSMPTDALQAAVASYADKRRGDGIRTRMILSPVVDGSYLPAHPFDPIAADTAANVPIMIGTTRDEMGTFLARLPKMEAIGDRELAENVSRVLGERTTSVLQVYRDNRPDANAYELLVALASEDRRLLSIETAQCQCRDGNAPVYMYRFDWETDFAEGRVKAGHALDTPFVFGNVDASPMTGTRSDRHEFAAIMSETWLAFAKNGDPNHAALPRWPAFDTEARATMIFDMPCRLELDPNAVERRAWHDIPVNLPWEGPAFVGAFNR